MDKNLSTLFHDPLHIIAARLIHWAYGSFSSRERWGVLDRPAYGYGILKAAQMAQAFGYKSVTICEFGVANGDGLLAMIKYATEATLLTGVDFRIIGFDSGSGMPIPRGYKDHPEVWQAGDFPLVNAQALHRKINGRAELILGNIDTTVRQLRLTEDCPLGFVSIDTDYYTSAVSALRCLEHDCEEYLPAFPIYFDDTAFYSANDWCGELAAIHEFNYSSVNVRIDRDRLLPGTRPVKHSQWYSQMYTCHMLCHTARRIACHRGFMTMTEHREAMETSHLS